MKKFLAMLMACAMALTMLCMPVMAEEDEPLVMPEAVPLEEQLEFCYDIDALLPFVSEGWAIAGGWFVYLMQNRTYGNVVDPEGAFGMRIEIHPDGRAYVLSEDFVYRDCVLQVKTNDAQDSLFFYFYYEEDGKVDYLSTQMLPFDICGWDHCPTMVVFTEDWFMFLQSTTDGDYVRPVDEETYIMTSQYVADVTAESITAISEDWTLKYGFTNWGRFINYDDFDTYYTSEGMDLDVVVSEDGTLEAFMLSEPDSYDVRFFVVEDITSDGLIVAEGEEAIFFLLEDGKLKMGLNNATYIFEKAESDPLTEYTDQETVQAAMNVEIDPLTEYTDKETVQAVQAAMNAEGFECGTPDGVAGKKTAAAISGFQAANGLTETGTITHELLECLRTKGYDI